MALDQESINAQLAQLASHRQRLALLLEQQAKFGAYTPPYVLIDIQEAQSSIRRIKDQLRADRVRVEDEPNDDVQPATVAAPSRLSPQEQRNRRAMLSKVKTIWIEGLLQQSLAKELRIALDLTEQPDAVVLPLNALVQELRHPPRPISAGTPIIKVFDQISGALLILGAPGAGKTTLLLELARDLIARAEEDEGHPIPVVFNLSSWAEKRRSLKEWLVDELNTKYDVSRKVGKEWVWDDTILPLLDGLDEVAAEHRAACVEAINVYRQQHGLVPLAVCSRVADYEALTTKLRLQGAIVVQPLTKQQVDGYLERLGEPFAGVRAALLDDEELLDTPLMLSIVALTYAGKSAVELRAAGTPKERRWHLFDAYTERMFKRRSKETRYTREQTTHWLSWLASRMSWHAQTIFLIEQLQPDWLPAGAAPRWYIVLDRCISGLVVGLGSGLVYGLVGGLVYGPVGLVYGLIVGLVVGLGVSFFGGTSDLETLQQRRITHVLFDALRGFLVFGLVYGPVGLVYGLVYGLGGGLVIWLGGGLLGVLAGKPGIGPRQVIVIERLHWMWRRALRAAMSGLLGGLLGGLVYGVVGGLLGGLAYGLLGGLVVGLVFWLVFGLGYGLLGGLVLALVGGLVGGPVSPANRPNEGIRRSAQSALVGALVGGLVGALVGLVFALVGALGYELSVGLSIVLTGGPVFGLVFGLVSALAFGGYACQSHLVLRLLLSRNGSLPLRLIPFLDYCAERIFLRKVGGGYIFVHRLLMEHFASLYTGQPAAPPSDEATD
jgi:eukaryotic-like serine/threonine-protein kinase